MGRQQDFSAFSESELRAALTPREFEVVELVRAGLPNPAIAKQLGLRLEAVSGRLARARRKLEPKSLVDPTRHLSEVLTAWEQLVVELVCEGLKNDQIAQSLEITKAVAMHQLEEIFAKLGVSSRVELAALAVQQRETSELDEVLAEALIQQLSDREREVAKLIAQKLRNKEIASLLGISVATVQVHIARILRRLNMRSRVQILTQYVLAQRAVASRPKEAAED